MADQKTILEYAIKGIDAEIAEIETSIRKGKKLVEEGQRSVYDIQPIINLKKSAIEKLLKLKGELSWQVAMIEDK